MVFSLYIGEVSTCLSADLSCFDFSYLGQLDDMGISPAQHVSWNCTNHYDDNVTGCDESECSIVLNYFLLFSVSLRWPPSIQVRD